MKRDDDTRPLVSTAAPVREELLSFFTENVNGRDVEWWYRHPYETSLEGRVSPWRRVPELQRQLFSATGSPGDDKASAELQDLQASLRHFREAFELAVSPQAAAQLETFNPSLSAEDLSGVELSETEAMVDSSAISTRSASISRRRRFWIMAAGVGVIGIAATISYLMPHDRVGLEVFERPPVAADTARMIDRGVVRATENSDYISESSRLLDEVAGFTLYGARTSDGSVCLIVERDRDGQSTCVSQTEFENQGISYYLTGYIEPVDRPSGFEDGDVLRIEWTNQSRLIIEPVAR